MLKEKDGFTIQQETETSGVIPSPWQSVEMHCSVPSACRAKEITTQFFDCLQCSWHASLVLLFQSISTGNKLEVHDILYPLRNNSSWE